MYKQLLKQLNKSYDTLKKIQYELIMLENYVEIDHDGSISNIDFMKIEHLKEREQKKIELIKQNMKELEKIVNNL